MGILIGKESLFKFTNLRKEPLEERFALFTYLLFHEKKCRKELLLTFFG